MYLSIGQGMKMNYLQAEKGTIPLTLLGPVLCYQLITLTSRRSQTTRGEARADILFAAVIGPAIDTTMKCLTPKTTSRVLTISPTTN